LIIFLFCIAFILLSAIEEDPLDLGNVVIEGKTASIKDSVNSIRDFDQFYRLASIEQFEYSAYFSPMVVKPPIRYDDKNNYVIQLKGGLDKYTSINSAISANDIYKFSASFYNHEKNENWIERTYSLQWQPQLEDHQIIFDITSFKFTSEIGVTEVQSGLLSYENNNLKFNGISDLIWRMNLQSEYHDITQVEETAKDIDIKSKIAILKNNYNAAISVNMLQQKVSGYSTIGLSNLRYLNRLGLWLAYDEDNIYPSIQLITKFKIVKDLNLVIENDPEISTRSRIDGFNDNLLQSIFAGKFQTKKIINSFVTIQSDHFTPVSIFYNAQLDRDHYMYKDVDDNGLYEMESIDCLIHKIGMKLVYEYDRFAITENMEYKISDDQLYFEPLFISSTSYNYNKSTYNFGLTINAYTGGVDDNNEELKTAVLVDLDAAYQLRKNISILAEVKNLLDNDYRKYHNYIPDELRLIIGFRMLF